MESGELPGSNVNNNNGDEAASNITSTSTTTINNNNNNNSNGNINNNGNVCCKNAESSEEKYFVVEFTGLIDRLAMKDKLASAKFIGIETNEPMLQIDNCFFRGQYQLTLGTNVIFDQKDINFVAKTDKKLLMKRVFLN